MSGIQAWEQHFSAALFTFPSLGLWERENNRACVHLAAVPGGAGKVLYGEEPSQEVILNVMLPIVAYVIAVNFL